MHNYKFKRHLAHLGLTAVIVDVSTYKQVVLAGLFTWIIGIKHHNYVLYGSKTFLLSKISVDQMQFTTTTKTLPLEIFSQYGIATCRTV